MVDKVNNYELLVIIKPQIPENVKFAVESKIVEILESNKGKLLGSEVLGRRKLAYPIKKVRTKYTEGLYVLYNFQNSSNNLHFIRDSLKSNENILRFLIVKKER